MRSNSIGSDFAIKTKHKRISQKIRNKRNDCSNLQPVSFKVISIISHSLSITSDKMQLPLRKFNSLPNGLIPVLLNMALIIQLHLASAITQFDLAPIPMPCDSIKCPPDAEMQCPADSAIREFRDVNPVDLIKSNTIGGHDEIGIPPAIVTTESSMYMNDTLVDEVLFAQCCLSKKCLCNTCYIPSCEESKVLIELQPESMDTPGQCCGSYTCRPEPNCTEINSTEDTWLQNCQRCSCKSGKKLCEQVCDDMKDDNVKAICKSNNNYYEDGNRWVDGCYQCECNKTEVKCWLSFCASLNCPSDRQVHLTGSCCPVCWPKGHPMPSEQSGSYDEGYGYEYPMQNASNELPLETLPPILPDIVETTESSTSSTTSTTEAPKLNANIENSPKESTTDAPPCQARDFPNEVVVYPLNGFKDPHLYHIIIVILVAIIAGLYLYIRHLLAKQRSYRPVSNVDDKV